MGIDIQNLVQNCVFCNQYKNNTPKVEQGNIRELSKTSMYRVYVDFAVPFLGKYFSIIVDTYSKWSQVHIVKNIKADTIISKCREIFAAYGMPQLFVTDNDKTFTSTEFRNFLK